MKARFFMLLILLFFTAYAQAVTFKIATLSPDGSVWMEKMREGAAEIETKTNKRVSFKFYPGGVMGDDNSVLKKMRFNQLNGAAVTNGGLSTLYPDIQLYNLVLKFNSLEEIDYVRSKMDQKLIDGLDKKEISVLGFAELGMTYLMATHPIHNLAEIKAVKSWAPDNNTIVQNAQKAFGVSPIPLPLGDVLMGLQTGMLNVVAGTPTGAIALQWQTKIKYLNTLPMSYIFGVLAVNKKDFVQLSKEDQTTVLQVMARVLGELNQHSRDDNQKAMATLKSQGVEFINTAAEAVTELKALLQNTETDLVKNGGLSDSLVKELNQHLADFRAKK
jgi:TRAP-type transport system periplasmic protein